MHKACNWADDFLHERNQGLIIFQHIPGKENKADIKKNILMLSHCISTSKRCDDGLYAALKGKQSWGKEGVRMMSSEIWIWMYNDCTCFHRTCSKPQDGHKNIFWESLNLKNCQRYYKLTILHRLGAFHQLQHPMSIQLD